MHAPRIVPPGWSADYTYKSSIRLYLRQQYNNARLEGATAYIYIYSDANPHCLNLRMFVRDGPLTAPFRDARITMLDFERLQWLYVRTPGVAFNPGPAYPVLIKISKDGNLANAMIYPDLYLYHPWMIFGRTLIGDPKALTVPQLADRLQEFFRTNSEIKPRGAAPGRVDSTL